jgi:DNA gyrase subunit A
MQKNQPITFDLKQMLEAFVDHRRDVVTRKDAYLILKKLKSAHTS